jgi:2',3'-cyclic-nucleotide 2'-phosphodiesterase (5'-nucleotidase family)
VLVYVNGKVVQELCDFIAAKGGMPVSGISMEIKAGKAQNILIKNLPIEGEKKYCILTSDFLANGGDKLTMLATAEKKVPGIKVRDAIVSYIESQTTNGKIISVKLEGRITNAK